jgi:predicted KAP-like P-loop ATPase
MSNNTNILSNEVAITSKDEDLLNYYPFAIKIKEIIQGYSKNPEPLTIGIYGKWGAGKTSLLNLIEKHIELFQKDKDDKPYIKFHYSPWLYQSKEEMLFDFFETLSRKLIYRGPENLKKAGKFIKKYSRYLKSIKLSASTGIPKVFNAGVTIEPYEILQKLGEDLEGEEKSLEEMKKDIDTSLLESNKKIIIFIDDIDRLDKDEIFTLFKLIKVNADFKNLVFIVCMDQDHVAEAIHSRYGKNIKSGYDFLEKIINIHLELPLIEKADLDFFVKEKIKPILNKKIIKKEELDELYSSLNGNYFENPREVIRILNSFAVSLYSIGEEVNIHDLFWIEYIKIKYLEVYKVIKEYGRDFRSKQFFQSSITFNTITENENEESGVRKTLKELNEGVSYKIIDFLFPMKRQNNLSAFQSPQPKPEKELNRELRINHIDHFEKYFSYHTQGKISEVKFSKYKTFLSDGKEEEALATLKEILSNTKERIIVYRILSEINIEKKEEYEKHIPFLLNNLELFQEKSNRHHSIEIIQSIAEKLRDDNPINNKELCISISENLTYSQLCWFTGTLKQNSNITYVDDLENIIIEKVKKSENHPFFKDRDIARMVMQLWSKNNTPEFQEYILKHLDTKENTYSFFSSFPHLWNQSINGTFKIEDYVFLTENLKLDLNLILKKVITIFPSLDDLGKLQEDAKKWYEHDGNSGLDNVKQFVFQHLNYKEKSV